MVLPVVLVWSLSTPCLSLLWAPFWSLLLLGLCGPPFQLHPLTSLWAAYLGTAGLLLIVRGKLLFSVLALLEVAKSSHLFRLFYFVPRQDFDPLNILFGVKCVP